LAPHKTNRNEPYVRIFDFVDKNSEEERDTAMSEAEVDKDEVDHESLYH
jgi:hypothetical protein